ncbi:MAG: TIGR03915 family putative DNA repair protein [Oscillospiraceae bacterium]
MQNNLAYIYDGSYEGFLCAVFASYTEKEQPALIAVEENLQVTFGQELRRIETDGEKAARVEAGFRKKVGEGPLENCGTGFLSCEPEWEMAVFRYMRLGFAVGEKIIDMLPHPDVLPLNNICKAIRGEAHFTNEFARFAQMDNGVFFARITPKNNVLPLVMPHFAARFAVQPFVIYDTVRQLAGIFDTKGWQLMETDGAPTPKKAEGEEGWTEMWKSFYNAIAIKERLNPKLRRSNCPKRYWQNMPEMPVDIYRRGN